MCSPLPRGPSGDRMPYKLLLADDSVTIQRVIELTFAEEDVTVTAVSDGQQAIDLIQAVPPDIVLADVGMPKRDGYEVAAFIKNDTALAHIPVLLLTGAFEPIDDERAKSVRCDGVLAKPFEPQLLISRVKALLAGMTPSLAEPSSPDSDEQIVAASAELGAPAGTDTLSAVQALLTAPAADEPAIDEDATIRLSRPPMFAEEDLRLDVESLQNSPEPPPVSDATLDEYFDRLDAAFAHLTAGQADHDPTPAPEAAAVEPWSSTANAAGGRPPEVPAPAPEADAPSSPSDDLEAAAAAVAVDVPDAFVALLDAEREHGPDAARLGAPGLAAGIVLPGTAVTQAFIDQVVRRVTERLAEPALRVKVAEIVSAVAERLVREEIARLKAGIRS
jgi:CheY-like chemotaxis protein